MTDSTPSPHRDVSPGAPQLDPPPTPVEPAAAPSPGDTVGTGSVIALGCIGATLFLIVLGLVYLLIAQVFG